jgi:Coenzyme PQQ synthesis protein D (PqqD)
MAGYPRRAQGTAFRAVGDEGGFVVLPARSEVKVLNPAGALIFSLLDGGHSPEQIRDAVAREFDVPADQAMLDVEAFLRDLADHGMLADDLPSEVPS